MNININVDKIKEQAKKAWDQNPLGVIAATGMVMTGAAKLLGSVTDARNARTWKKEVDRRRMKL
jgi:hypothetical protein